MDVNKLGRGDLQNLQNQETDFDQNAMWKNINPEKKKRRSFIWFWLVGGAGMILLFTGLFFYTVVENDSTAVVATRPEKSTKVLPVPVISNSAKKINTENISSNTTQHSSTTSENKNSQNEDLNLINISQEKFNSTDNKRKGFYHLADKIDLKNLSTKPGKLSAETKRRATDNKPLAIFPKKETEKQKTNTRWLAALPNIPQLQLNYPAIKLTTAILPDEVDKEVAPKSEEGPSEEGPIIPNKNTRFTLSAFAGIGYQFRTLQYNGESEESALLTVRNSSETVLESLAFGFEIDKNIGKKWTIGLGVEMIQHTEKMVLENRTIDNLADLNREEIPDQYQGNSGFLIRFQDAIFYNQHRLVHLPIRLGYRFQYKKIRLVPELGIVLNLSQYSSGHILTDFETTEPITSYFQSQFGLSYRLGCKVMIPAGKQFSLYVRPSFEWNPMNVASFENPISQRRSLLRLDLGISRNF